ncbi:MAG: PEP-utilizing enzyme [Candidatus Pacebacteria bacterium]|nr:PEP-utilizing enzyme [Candidatus Paceibacterota bacterium]
MKIYDNSNLAESYSGVTTPLTSSFARYVYQEVYKNFCQMMGVSNKTIKENSDMFPEMVVYIGGRMYYDLTNWYRLVSFLPGYSFNKGFFEQMLGVDKEGLFKKDFSESFFLRWFYYFPKTLWQGIKIFVSFIFMKKHIKNFCFNFDNIYEYYNSKDLSQESEVELKDIFNNITNKLVVHWKVPIANDFAVMISTGVVHKLFKKWLPGKDSYTFLYVGSTLPLISLDPGLVIIKIVEEIKNDENLFNLFNSGKESKEILVILKNKYKTNQTVIKIFDYIKKYGDRMPGELKLESKCLKENPEIFIQIIANSIKNNIPFLNKNIQHISIDASEIGFLKYMVLSFFLKWAKKSIQMREETRFKRTLIFGFARKIFIEFGKKYSKRNIIDNSDDIFYLTLEEILGNVDMEIKQLKSIIKERKNSLVLWKGLELPRRIETELMIVDFEKTYKEKKIDNIVNAKINGMIVSIGEKDSLLGEALVMKEFNSTANFNDKIIITTHTDPGWSLIFPFVRGLVVERGGMLSHAAIIARELGIPCIVGVKDVTNIIKTGDKIELNLKTGEIIIK